MKNIINTENKCKIVLKVHTIQQFKILNNKNDKIPTFDDFIDEPAQVTQKVKRKTTPKKKYQNQTQTISIQHQAKKENNKMTTTKIKKLLIFH